LTKKQVYLEVEGGDKQILETSDLLIGRIKQEEKIIWKKINECSKNTKRFDLIELSDDLIILIRKTGKSQLTCHIGFPFPLHSFSYYLFEKELSTGITVDIFLRGEEIRKRQRNTLFNIATEIVKLKDTEELRRLVSKDFAKAKGIVYIDPYSFIGDSYISLFYPEAFMKEFNIKDIQVFSNSYSHLNVFYPSAMRELHQITKAISKKRYVIMPDLIDNQWKNTLEVILALGGMSANIVIPGRNLYIKKEDNHMRVYWYEHSDILLRNKNIQDYMEDTLKPFLKKTFTKFDTARYDSSTIFVNPFGLASEKAIPIEFMFSIYNQLRKKYGNLNFNIVGGYYDCTTHKDWIEKFLKKVRSVSEINGKISISYYSNLKEFAKDLENNKCSVVISADTSITHLVNKLGYPNICIYNSLLWDKDSIQSMTSDSPLGFCRYIPTHIPVLLKEHSIDHYSYLAKYIGDLIEFLRKPYDEKTNIIAKNLGSNINTRITSLEEYQKLELQISNKLKWITEIYNPIILLGGLFWADPKKIMYLIRSAIKISPLYKLQRLIKKRRKL